MKTKNWKKVVVRDICERINYGYTASATHKAIGPKFLRITDIVPELINWDTVPFCQISDTDFTKYELQEGDIVIARTGATSGYAKRIKKHPPAIFASYLVRLRIKKAIDNRFIGLIVESDDYKRFIMTNIGGSAQPQANAQILTSYPLLLPPLLIQDTIASILSAYDDLIENNTRRIAILEEMAQMLYQEWFVKFRFPGYEQVKMVESELGMIPEGWRMVIFSEIAELSRVGIDPSKFKDETFTHYSIPAFDEGRVPVVEQGGNIKSNKYLIPKGVVLLSKLNPRIPRAWLPMDTNLGYAVTSTEFLVLMPKAPYTREFVYSFCISQDFIDIFVGKAIGTSTSHQRVKPENLMDLPVVLAPPQITKDFIDIVIPIFKLVQCLQTRNIVLRRTRDLLLPKLISGEIDVSGWVEGNVEELVASAAMGAIHEYEPTGKVVRKVAEAEPIEQEGLEWRSLWDE